MAGIDPALEAGWGGHPGVSQLAAIAAGAPAFVPEILGQHHGFSPPVAGYHAANEVFGGPAWQRERERLIAALKEALQTDWPQVASAAQARLLPGLTSVAGLPHARGGVSGAVQSGSAAPPLVAPIGRCLGSVHTERRSLTLVSSNMCKGEYG